MLIVYRLKTDFFCLFLGILFSISPLSGQEKAYPMAGEGISTFLLRHNRAPKKYYDDFVELNKLALGKKHSLRMGVSYLIPPPKGKAVNTNTPATDTASNVDVEDLKRDKTGQKARKGNRHEPLFGSSLANVKATSQRLAGACFYVVSGHGGPDPGAIGKVGNYELHEDEYAYDIALRLARVLMQEGAEVRIIIQDAKDGIRDDAYLLNSKRETCMGDEIPLNQVARLRQRCEKINALYRKDRKNYTYCRAIFIHVDSRSKGNQTDVFFYYSKRKTDSRRLAVNMQNTFGAKYGKHQPNRGFAGTVSERNLYVLSNTTPSSVFVELGNIQNSFDQKRLIIPSNRQALAKWLMEGFRTDYKNH